MKTLKQFIVMGCFLLAPTFVSAQAVCISQIVAYDGPTNTSELSDRLHNSGNSILASMDEATKQSLIDHIVFDNGLPSYLDDTDANIIAIDQSSSAEAIWGAILKCHVICCTYDTKPSVTEISYSAFMSMYNSDPIAYAFHTGISKCENCIKKVPNPCCEVGGTGCFDNFTEILSTGARYRVIID